MATNGSTNPEVDLSTVYTKEFAPLDIYLPKFSAVADGNNVTLHLKNTKVTDGTRITTLNSILGDKLELDGKKTVGNVEVDNYVLTLKTKALMTDGTNTAKLDMKYDETEKVWGAGTAFLQIPKPKETGNNV